jgi:predicted MFS family arabinose efflux permease
MTTVTASTRGRAHWTLALLTLVFAVNQLDRGVVAILLESIKAEMHLSDTALGLMTGLGFALLYSIASIPLGRLADRGNRARVIGIGILLYSVFTAAMGFAQNIVQLCLARSAVAIGEASGNAPSAALISDLYPAEQRSRALSLWSAGSYLGLFAGLAFGGWLSAHYGWRAALWAVSVPGLIIGVACLTTIPDSGGAKVPAPKSGDGTPSAWLHSQTYRWIFVAMTLSGIVAYSVQIWTPSLLARVHGMGPAQVGFYAGLFKGLCGLGGILTGGYLAAALARGRPSRLGIVPIVATGLVPIALLVFLFATGETASLIGLGFASFLIPAYQGPALTMIHAVVPREGRAGATASVLAAVTLAGLGLGPLSVGSISDRLVPAFGADSLRYALLVPAIVPVAAMLAFWRASVALGAETEIG